MTTSSSDIIKPASAPVSAIGISLCTLLMITALALILTPIILPQISNNPSTLGREEVRVSDTTAQTVTKAPVAEPALRTFTLTHPLALAAATLHSDTTTSTHTVSRPEVTTKTPETPTPATKSPLVEVQIGNQGIAVNVNDVEIRVDRTTLQPVSNVIKTVSGTTDKLTDKL